MLNGLGKLVLLSAMLAPVSCTHQIREQDAFRGRKTIVLTEGIERHNVELRTPDGPILRGWYLTPKAPRRHLVYLYGSGGSVVQEYGKLHWLAQTYDMDILVVDYPGYGFSEGSPTVDGLARASLRIYDFMAARWPHAEGPIFVYGHSMGTAFALHVGLNRPGTPVILEAPLTSVQDLAAAIKQRVPWYARLFLTIKIDPELTRWRQPVDMIPQLVGPLLIIHGTDDHTIPFAQGKRLFEAATTKQKHFCALAGEGHSPVEPNRDRRTDLGCLAAFLDAYGDAVRPSVGAPAQAAFRLKLCTEAPIHLEGPPGAQQSRGCVVTFTQELSDPAIIRWVGANRVERRYLVYAPANLPPNPAPVVLVFPGSSASAESVAFHTTHTRFETLADQEGFIVVYGNGLPNSPESGEKPTMPKGGFLQGCFLEHSGEGVDVTYVRRILDQLETELKIDRSRVFATGLSAGGGMSFQLALEAPDLVAAIAPVAGLPFQPSGEWLGHCHPKPGYDHISIAMLAATQDPSISYAPGSSRQYANAHYPGMEETRDAWLAAMKIHGPPTIDKFPDRVQGDSYEPDTHLKSSTIERQRYPLGPDGQEFWYYKAEGMGHWWPNPTQMWNGLWRQFGKTNQDIDFADHAWEFFKRHPKH